MSYGCWGGQNSQTQKEYEYSPDCTKCVSNTSLKGTPQRRGCKEMRLKISLGPTQPSCCLVGSCLKAKKSTTQVWLWEWNTYKANRSCSGGDSSSRRAQGAQMRWEKVMSSEGHLRSVNFHFYVTRSISLATFGSLGTFEANYFLRRFRQIWQCELWRRLVQ